MVNNQQNTYNQPPMGQMMPPQGGMMPPMMPSQQPRMPLQHRMMKGARRILDIFPRWLTTYPVVTYIIALLVVSFMYSSYSLPWYYMLSGIIAVLANER